MLAPDLSTLTLTCLLKALIIRFANNEVLLIYHCYHLIIHHLRYVFNKKSGQKIVT